MADGIVSSSIVGYATQGNNSKAHPTMAVAFANVDGSTTTLKDIKVTGMTYQDDFIQFVDPSTSVVDTSKIYSYYFEEEGSADNGWYWFDIQNPLNERFADDDPIPQATAFLATFNPSHVVTFTYSGQVVKGPVVIDTKVDGEYVGHMFIANPYPTAIKLKDIEVTGMTYQDDCIQFVDPNSSTVDTSRIYSYYFDEVGSADNGWYWFDIQNPLDERFADEDEIPMGDGFICTVNPSHQVRFTFKALSL